MAAGLVNNTIRQIMADTRLFYEGGGWCDLGHVPTYVSPTSFTIPTDVTAFYGVGRRIRMYGAIMGTFYGYVVSSAYSSPNTTVTVVLDSGALTSNLSRVDLSFFEQLATGISAQGIVGRNKIINGKMDIYQRGSSFPAIANSYGLDRWFYANAGTSGVVTMSAQADVPSSNEFQTSLRVLVTTADTTQDAGDYSVVGQRVEGANARDLIGKTFTLSFWVRSAKTGTHCAYFKNSGLDRTYVMEYTVNAANTWEYKTLTVTGGLITAGTWNWTTGIGVEVGFVLMAGSTFRTTANTWQTGSFAATANQVNVLDTVNNIFAITGVQLEAGSAATPFEHRFLGQELVLCQRYFEQGFARGTNYSAGAGNYRAYSVPFAVTKRVGPAMGTNSVVYGGAGANSLVIEYVDSTMHSSRVTTTSAGSFIVDYNWNASAEL
jgi:hypothetical protein